MYDVILLRYGELALKGENRPFFERALKENICKALPNIDPKAVKRRHGRFFVDVAEEEDIEKMLSALSKVFGLVSISPAVRLPLDLDAIKEGAFALGRDVIPIGGTFKVQTKRANKGFPFSSPEINKEVGGYILPRLAEAKVDVHEPDVIIDVEVREDYAYVTGRVIPGPGGLPLGTSGHGLLLLSGGLDSPVAGWMCMKRGLSLTALHFHSFPFTSQRSKEKVIDIAQVLTGYAGELRLIVAFFTNIQKEIQTKVPEKLRVILMRRMMMRIAQKIAQREGALVLVTGESLGQVASQTLESINVTNQVVDLPVFRPLIGMDKSEIIDRARAIGTYDISIRPYEDCCTLFVPRHPSTRPALQEVEDAEAGMDIQALVEEAIEKSKLIIVNGRNSCG